MQCRVVICTRRCSQFAEHRVVIKHAWGENTRGEKREERNPLTSYFSRTCHQSRGACYPALGVLSSHLSVSFMRIHVAQKTTGVSSYKLRRIASLI